METISRHSRNMLTVIVGLLLLFSLSCSDDPSSPKKDAEDPIPQDVVTIGVEGGTVEKDDISITIPAGAFDGNYDISVSEVQDDGAFGENTVTPSFKISGIPRNYSKPLKIIAKYSGELSSESYLGVGKKAHGIYDIFEIDSSIMYDFYRSTDSSGFLISSIPTDNFSNNLLKISGNEIFELFPKFFTGYLQTKTPHFDIKYPETMSNYVTILGEIFEAAYEVVYVGIYDNSYELSKKEIYFNHCKEPIRDNGSILSQSFEVSIESVFDQQYNSLLVEAAKRMYLSSSELGDDPPREWYKYSIYVWIEDLLSDDPNYKYPKWFLDYGMEPFKGLNVNLSNFKNSVKNHGVGMSVFSAYLYEFTDHKINEIIPSLSTENNLTIIQVWPDFFKKYVNNELFELPNDYFIENAHAEWDINSETDISKTFTAADVGKYQDLSAKMFKINLNYADLGDKQNLKFKMFGPEDNKDLSLILFSVKNNKLQYIQTTELAEYEIVDPKSYFEDGTGEFLAVLVNSNVTKDDYLGESEITLEINVSQKEKTILDYKNSAFSCSLWGKYENKWADGSLHYWEGQFGMSSIQYVPGEFTGNVFKGELTITGYYSSAPNSVIEISLTAELNETLDLISNFEFIRVTTFNNDSKGIRTEKVTGGNIPISPSINAHYILNGLDVCNDEITFIYEDLFYSLDGGENYIKIIEVGCTEESNLYFTFVE